MISRASSLITGEIGMHLTEHEIAEALAAFGDAQDVASWARVAVAHAILTGILQGQYIAPTAAATRADVAQMFYSMLSAN